jgi:hypothetical protein
LHDIGPGIYQSGNQYLVDKELPALLNAEVHGDMVFTSRLVVGRDFQRRVGESIVKVIVEDCVAVACR